MKATNIYQTLKTKGYGTDGMKPQLPGVGSPLKKSPYKFNAGLKKAAAEGKLDNNPKFKDAVESSPAKLAPVVAAVGKKLLVGAAKKMIAKKAAEKLKQKQGSPAMLKNGNGEPKKKGPKKLDKKTIAESNKNFEVMVEAFGGLGAAPQTKKVSKKVKKTQTGAVGTTTKTRTPAKGPKKVALDKKTTAQSNKNFETMLESFAGQPGAPKSIKPKKASPAKKYKKASPAKKKVDGKPKKEVKAQSITYDPASGTTTRTFSDADVKKYNIKKQIVTKAKEKTPAKKKGCGSPVRMDLGVAGPGNPKKAIRKAKRKATKGHKAGVRLSNACRRSTRGKGSTYRN